MPLGRQFGMLPPDRAKVKARSSHYFHTPHIQNATGKLNLFYQRVVFSSELKKFALEIHLKQERSIH